MKQAKENRHTSSKDCFCKPIVEYEKTRGEDGRMILKETLVHRDVGNTSRKFNTTKRASV